MQAIVRLYFDAKTIGMPHDLSDRPAAPDTGAGPQKFQECEKARESWFAECQKAAAANPLLSKYPCSKDNGWDFDGDHGITISKVLGSQDVLSLGGHVHCPFPREAVAVTSRATITLIVEAPQNEGYHRGIHEVINDAETTVIGYAVVTFDPTERTGQARYRIDGVATQFAPLARRIGNVLAGRVPEIIHSHKLPCA